MTIQKSGGRKKSTKSKSTKPTTRKAFGGYAISFAGRTETIEEIFGKKPIPPNEMIKKLWSFVKTKNLSNR